MSAISRRLTALERTGDATLGLRVFFQTLEDEDIFFDNDDGPAYTTAQLDELSAAGWQVLKVVYVTDWRPAG
jgi:hypothetical protein